MSSSDMIAIMSCADVVIMLAMIVLHLDMAASNALLQAHTAFTKMATQTIDRRRAALDQRLRHHVAPIKEPKP